MKMLLTGEMISANEAKSISLINDHVSKNELSESVMPLSQKIAQKSSKTLKIGKEAFYKQFEMNLSDAYEYTSRVMAENTLEDDAKEGINAFLEKRDPNWSDS
jgi:enoyl-CoA hydratase/carnithine racemase